MAVTNDQIKKARLKMGLTQKQLAAKIGYKSTDIIRKAERGELSGEKLDKILTILKLNGKPEKRSFTVYTDGSCESNPGGRGGYGVVIIDDQTGEYEELSDGYITTTNNRMEIMAVIVACKHLPKDSKAVIYSDSKYVVNTVNGIFQKNKNSDLWAELDKAMKGKSIKTVWIKGHNGNPLNETCDKLAADACVNKAINTDPGYLPANFKNTPGTSIEVPATGAMAIKIEVPDEQKPEIYDTAKYAKAMSINNNCAELIKQFYERDYHGFKAYMSLKTCGTDYWSSCSAGKLREQFAKDLVYIEEYFSSFKSVLSVLRWRGRGLTLFDAIRKVLVDEEVNRNAVKAGKEKGYQYRWNF